MANVVLTKAGNLGFCGKKSYLQPIVIVKIIYLWAGPILKNTPKSNSLNYLIVY